MRSFGVASAAAGLCATASLFVGSSAADVDPIVIKGSKFFYETNGTQFYIKGVAYQQSYTGATAVQGTANTANYNDPLADPAGCKRDLPYLKQLETNTVRVYAVNPDSNHDECMSMFADAGIYVIADLSAPSQSIDSNDPQWNDDLYTRYASVIDALQGYKNVLGFFAGNEVATQPNNTASAAFVKAATRDMKAYIAQQGYRTIGVGYAANDNPYIRVDLADFFNCGDDQSDAIDFYGYNVYSWCGESSYTESGYDTRTQEFESYSVPAFFAEYGCNTQGVRIFEEVAALYGPQMSPVWSGGIVYMYFQEANDYGLVSVDGKSVSTLADFGNYKTQIAKVHPTGVQMASYTPSNSPAACPSVGGDWSAASTPLPPTPNKQLCSCMTKSLSCVVDPSTPEEAYGDLFSYICYHDKKACLGTAANGTTATYGAYGMCDSSEQLSFNMNQYYHDNKGKDSNACNFKGKAKLQTSSNSGSCKALLAEAGKSGTGTVTTAPQVTGAGSSDSGSGSASSSTGAASALTVPRSESGLLPMIFIVVVSVFFWSSNVAFVGGIDAGTGLADLGYDVLFLLA